MLQARGYSKDSKFPSVSTKGADTDRTHIYVQTRFPSILLDSERHYFSLTLYLTALYS